MKEEASIAKLEMEMIVDIERYNLLRLMRLNALRKIRKRGRIPIRPYHNRKSELINYTETNGAIWRDCYGFIHSSRQEIIKNNRIRVKRKSASKRLKMNRR